MSKSTLTQRVSDLETGMADLRSGLDRIESLLLAQANPAAPAKAPKKAKAQPKADDGFVTWLRETAPARAERKATNRELAAAIRKVGLEPTGAVWAYAKKQTAAGKALNVKYMRSL